MEEQISKLQAQCLRGLLEYPQNLGKFLDLLPRKIWCKEANEILKIIEKLHFEKTLNFAHLEALLSEKIKNSSFFEAFCESIPSPNYCEFAESLILEWQTNRQFALVNKLQEAARSGAILDLELLNRELECENKALKTLIDWRNQYKNDPILPKIPTKVDFLDTAFDGGIEMGKLILIGGDPEAGKTSLGVQILENISANHKVGFFCFEFTLKGYLELLRENPSANESNFYAWNDGYNIHEVAQAIKQAYKLGVRVFLIDSQMRIESNDGSNMEENESAKFSILAKLCHSLGISIFLIIQFSKTDHENPLGTKKGGHEASIIIRIARNKPQKDSDEDAEYSESTRTIFVSKNKQTGKHFKELVSFDPNTRRFYKLGASPHRDIYFPNDVRVEFYD